MKVLITQAIDPAGIDVLTQAGLEIIRHEHERPITREKLLRRLNGCIGLISIPIDPIDAGVMDASPLKVIAQHAAGTDNIDLNAARQRGIIVTNTPAVLTEATADFTMALILAVTRRIVEGDAMVREGAFPGWHPLMLRGMDLHGACLGIIGYGRIGQAVAERARAFGMRVVHQSSKTGMPLNDLLKESDIVSLHCPLTPETKHLIGKPELALMKKSAFLINTARGPVVDEGALVHALEDKQLAGAALDVFEREPLIHPGLANLTNVVLAPHAGSATYGTRRRMALKAAHNLVAALKGEIPPDRVV